MKSEYIGRWTEKYAQIVYFFWEPQHINRRSAKPSIPWEDVWGRLGKRGAPLNLLMNIFFRLAPAALTTEIIHLGLPGFPVATPELTNNSGEPFTEVCQPDFAFGCGGHLAFIELKVSAKLTAAGPGDETRRKLVHSLVAELTKLDLVERRGNGSGQ